ncbi:MAG TPA: DNA primase [Burkholderiales bacterium]|jgi:DNA primase|nr:DNA primase [Burkholderiales bacterium]
MIPQSFVQELLGRVDIVDVVDRHVKLKRAGANYVACCPFHSEKTPSFTVSQTKQFYHCFGCGAHGTAIGFLIEYGGLGFVDAVKELAQSVGLKVPEDRPEARERRREESDDLHGVLLKAAQYYRSRLKDSSAAIDYLKKRGLSGEIARRFGIGYAPDGWQNLAAVFSDYDGKQLAGAGLVKSKEDGRRYDVFRDRIMFPIVDVRGMVIGFGGRILETGEPKYLNSPETPLFEKGKELYGLYQARRALREAGRVVVVEGYMDVVALAQSGIEYAVATLGTATTPLHVQKLLRQSDEIVFCFDGDGAGRRAAWRALENALAQLQDGKQVKFLFLPEGEDPDTFVRKHGKTEFERQLDGARPLSRYLLEELAGRVDLATAEGRANMLHAAKPLLKQMQANALRLQLVRELAEKCRSLPEEVAQLCELGQIAVSGRTAPASARIPARPVTSLVEPILSLLISSPGVAATVSEEQRILLDSPEMAPVIHLLDLLQESGATTAAMLTEVTRESPYFALYQEIAAKTMAEPVDEGMAKVMLGDALVQLERPRVEAEFQRLVTEGQRNDVERQRFQTVSRRLRELKGALPVGQHPAA